MQMGASGFTSRSTREVKTSIGAAADSPTTLDCQTVSKYSKLDIFFVPFATRQCRASFFVHCVHGELPWLGNSNGRDSGERNPDIDNYPDIKRDDHCRSSPSPFLCTSYFVTLYLVSLFLHARSVLPLIGRSGLRLRGHGAYFLTPVYSSWVFVTIVVVVLVLSVAWV